MKYGMVRAAAVTPTIKVGNPQNNAREISARIADLVKQGAEIIVFPELCVTGYTAADLFFRAVCWTARSKPSRPLRRRPRKTQ